MSTKKRILILGGRSGLLGQALAHVFQEANLEVVTLGRADLNIFDSSKLKKFLEEIEPGQVINTIAYTQVDAAEHEPEKAFKLNKSFPALLGRILGEKQLPLVHYSTDFAFDGTKDSPYTPEDDPHPLSVYGQSKLEGEKALVQAGLPQLLILRTAWLFGPWKSNFVQKILSLAESNSKLQIIHDQMGSPTYTLDLAHYTLNLLNMGASGTYHLVNKGRASWCELAAEAISVAGSNCLVQAITSDQYPQEAKRPAYSVLDTSAYTDISGEKPRPWTKALREYIYAYLQPQTEHD
jgi:dTDP-4-dehydrorhamnose reductase